MITYSESVQGFLCAIISAGKTDGEKTALLDGLSYGLALSAHRPTFAGQMLEEISINKADWKSIVRDLLTVADVCDQE